MAVLDSAVAWWHADRYDPGTDTQWEDQSGNAHHAQLGSTSGADSNDPTFLPYDTATSIFVPTQTGQTVSAIYSDDGNYDVAGGDIDVQFRFRVPAFDQDVLLATTYTDNTPASADLSWRVIVNSGTPRFRYGASGVYNVPSDASLQSAGFSAGDIIWLRVTCDVDNGSGDADIKFYTSPDGTSPGTWTQLGTTQNSGTTSALPTGTTCRMALGCDGLTSGGSWVDVYLYRVILKEGIAGTVRFDWDTSGLSAGATSDTPDTGSTVTIYRGTSLEPVVVNRNLWLMTGDDYFEVTDHADLDVAAGEDFTVMVAFRKITDGVTASLADKGGLFGLNTGWGLSLSNSEQPGIYTKGPSTLDTDAGSAIANSQEHTAAGRGDRTAAELEQFTDGAGTGSPDISWKTDSVATSNPLRIGAGAQATVAYYMKGVIVGVAVFKSALSDGDISTLHSELLADQTGATTYTATASADAALTALGLTRTAVLDAVLQLAGATNTATASVDAALAAVGLTRSVFLDAVVEFASTRTADVDAVVQRYGIARTTLIDAALRAAATRATSLDARIELATAAVTRQASLDALLMSVGLERQTALDSVVRLLRASQASLDAAIAAEFSSVSDIDAALAVVYGLSVGLDARVEDRTKYLQTDADAAVLRRAAVTLGVNALILSSAAVPVPPKQRILVLPERRRRRVARQ